MSRVINGSVPLSTPEVIIHGDGLLAGTSKYQTHIGHCLWSLEGHAGASPYHTAARA
jgi:hypothetical protein